MALAVAPLWPPPTLAGWRRRLWATPPRFPVVLAASNGIGGERAPPTFGRLREELLQLHAEAGLTQSKGNMAITVMLSVVFIGLGYATVLLSELSDTSHYSKREPPPPQSVQFDLSPVTWVLT